MTKDEFKQLKAGDRFTHSRMPGIFTVGFAHTWHEWPDGPGTTPVEVTIAVETTDGRYLKIDDTDVNLITKLEAPT